VKLGLVFGSVVFLIAGITLAGNSLEVTGQSDLGEAQDILNTASNATQTAIDKTMNLLSNVSNNVTDAGLNTSSNLTEPINATEEGLQKYENARYGISFMYPPEWGEATGGASDDCPPYKQTEKACGPRFMTLINDTDKIVDKIGPADGSLDFKKFISAIDMHNMGVLVFELDKSTKDAEACNCKTLRDFVRWDYTNDNRQNVNFINDNQTIIGSNHTAWQTETTSAILGIPDKHIYLYAINGNVGYKFQYIAQPGPMFDQHLNEFKNMLKTVTFYTPEPEKKPSFLNSNEIANLTSIPTVQDESIKIASSNDFIDSIGYLHVVGEVQNNTPTNAQFVKVTGTFYDSSDNVVATDFTYTNPSDIGSGQKAPFQLTLTSASIPISQIDHYNLQASYQ